MQYLNIIYNKMFYKSFFFGKHLQHILKKVVRKYNAQPIMFKHYKNK